MGGPMNSTPASIHFWQKSAFSETPFAVKASKKGSLYYEVETLKLFWAFPHVIFFACERMRKKCPWDILWVWEIGKNYVTIFFSVCTLFGQVASCMALLYYLLNRFRSVEAASMPIGKTGMALLVAILITYRLAFGPYWCATHSLSLNGTPQFFQKQICH